MTGEPTQTISKALHVLVYQLSSEKGSSHYASLPTVFNLLPTSKKKYLKSNCVIYSPIRTPLFPSWEEPVQINEPLNIMQSLVNYSNRIYTFDKIH